jgi:hypothetical protein
LTETGNHEYDLLKVDSEMASPILEFGGDLAVFRIGHTDENRLVIDTRGYVISRKEYAITAGNPGEYIECAGRIVNS